MAPVTCFDVMSHPYLKQGTLHAVRDVCEKTTLENLGAKLLKMSELFQECLCDQGSCCFSIQSWKMNSESDTSACTVISFFISVL